jgi:hypothetical protein
LGRLLGDFFANSSGHPAAALFLCVPCFSTQTPFFSSVYPSRFCTTEVLNNKGVSRQTKRPRLPRLKEGEEKKDLKLMENRLLEKGVSVL